MFPVEKMASAKSLEVGLCLGYLGNKRLVCWSRASEERLARDRVTEVVKEGRR